jgi:hypothetical protein
MEDDGSEEAATDTRQGQQKIGEVEISRLRAAWARLCLTQCSLDQCVLEITRLITHAFPKPLIQSIVPKAMGKNSVFSTSRLRREKDRVTLCLGSYFHEVIVRVPMCRSCNDIGRKEFTVQMNFGRDHVIPPDAPLAGR